MFLKLNPSKLDLIYFGKSFRLIEYLLSINISSNLSLASSPTVHSLGFTFDFSPFLIPQIKSLAKSSIFHLRRIEHLKLFQDNPTLKLLVSSLILSRFDYWNFLYYGLLETTLRPLTKAFNSTARLVSGTHKFSRLTPTLMTLHWLPLKNRSVSKICTLMFKTKKNHSPNYLADLFKLPLRKGLRSTHSHFLGYLLIVLMLNLYFPTVGPFYETLFPPISPVFLLFFLFVKPLELYSLNGSYQSALEQC